MLTNRPEFHFADSAVMHLGATPFSIYNTYTVEQIEHLLSDAGSRVVITEQGLPRHDPGCRQRGDSTRSSRSSSSTETPSATRSRSTSWPSAGQEGFDFEAAWRAVEPDDVLTLIYTSGTTGPPEGRPDNAREHLRDGSLLRRADRVPRRRADRLLPADGPRRGAKREPLPARCCCGFTITCCPDPREVIAYLPEVRPTWFFAVPRIWEKLKAGLEQMLAAAPAEQRAGMRAGAGCGDREGPPRAAGRRGSRRARGRASRPPTPRCSRSLRAHLGLDEVEACNVGAAPTPPEVIEFFHALGIPLAELWGMSETTGAGTCNPPERIKIGTVGPPAPGVEIKLADDGEVMIRGPGGHEGLPEPAREDRRDDHATTASC